MKKRSYLGMGFLLWVTLGLSLNLQPIAKIPEYSSSNAPSIVELTGFWSHLIKIERSQEEVVVLAQADNPQTVKVAYKLFGLFPIKISEVEVMPDMKLLPGGQSIGVSLHAKGVMIVGQAPVINKNGEKIFPGREAGIEVGDIILKVAGKEVHSDQEVATAINEAGKQNEMASLIIKHQGQLLEKVVKTVYCPETGRYRVGFYVRDEAAGVGTLTFYDPKSQKFGALGHVINDADTNQRIDVWNGSIIASNIYGIEKGKRGHPGEKVGSFVNNSKFKGQININSTTGVFGTMDGEIANPYFAEAISVGWSAEVHEGSAKMYTVIKGEKIEEFDVTIEKILKHRTDSKNMVIRVTDPRLIELTGGIIQGMSGSPLVQDGKLIGAVTHVFVNDSTRGYGVFIENMLQEAEMLEKSKAA